MDSLHDPELSFDISSDRIYLRQLQIPLKMCYINLYFICLVTHIGTFPSCKLNVATF